MCDLHILYLNNLPVLRRVGGWEEKRRENGLFSTVCMDVMIGEKYRTPQYM